MEDTAKHKYKVVASIVTYDNPSEEVARAARSFLACSLKKHLILIDNDTPGQYLNELQSLFHAQFIQSGANKGFGYAHNIGIRFSPDCEYYLVLNPDVEIPENCLETLVTFMDVHQDVGVVSPRILGGDGSIQHLNKRAPTVFDLFARRFLPQFICNLNSIKKRMNRYVMLDVGYDKVQQVLYMTGCFMLFRKSVLDKIGGFDEGFFMYLEDADITRRVNMGGFKSIYYPFVSVKHRWAKGSHHSFKLTWITIKSALYYFKKWGWQWI